MHRRDEIFSLDICYLKRPGLKSRARFTKLVKYCLCLSDSVIAKCPAAGNESWF